MDPVPELAALASEYGIGCHVDACIGGFVLPFLERIGHDVPPWDFRVPGVTEMSADVHKYGYTPKGASLVLHRDGDWFGHQVFLYDQWPSGTYGSPAMAGARPAAPIAVAWAVLEYLGEDGFCEIVRGLRDTFTKLRAGIDAIDGLRIVGDPVGPVLCFEGVDGVDAYAVGDVMDDKGWHLNRNKSPRSLHLMVSPAHAARLDDLLTDLADAVAHHGAARAKETRYS
jgi:glutamate/tyrosine decarboxylase-like PLP-dependent enzyme